MNKLLGLTASRSDHLMVAVLFDGKARHRFVGLGDAVDDALRPRRLDADDYNGSDVGVGAGADQGAEV